MSLRRARLWVARAAAVGALALLAASLSVATVADPDESARAPRPTTATTGRVPAPVALVSRAREAAGAASAANDRRGADLGVAVLDRATGDLATNDDGDTPMNAASLAKLFTVVDMLDQRASGAVSLSSGDLALVREALGPSDDAAMNTLWSRYGGADGVRRVIDLLDLADTTPPADPSQWGEVKVSARDMAALYRHVYDGLPATDRDLVVSALESAPPTADDGFDQGYGLLEPGSRGTAAAKQGWLCCLAQSIDLHSAGVLDPEGRYVVALLSNQPFGYAAARGVLDDAASAVRDALAPVP